MNEHCNHLSIRCRALLLGAALLVGLCPWRSAQCAEPEIYTESAVKAVFLYRFADYVQWPAEALAPRKFTIAVLGADEVATHLQELLPNHPILGLPAQVKQITEVRQLGDAQTLYVGKDYHGSLRALIAALRDRPVLVVSDVQGGLEAGSAVNFVLSEQHVRFEISTVAASQARLKISAELLAVASRIKAGNLPNVGCRVTFLAQASDALCLAWISHR
jgi:YfiR/HmsC-like